MGTRTVDSTRRGHIAQNGQGLRPGAMVEGSDQMVGDLAAWSASRSGVCPYRLGTNCPLVEIAEGAMRRRNLISHIAAASVGITITICVVMVIT